MSTTVEQGIPAGTYVVDPIHSSVGFAVAHNGLSTFRSSFKQYEATFEGGEAPKLSGSVDVASIDIADEHFKGHLLSPDFFDAENHPKLSFASTELSVAEDGTLKLAGELEIRGKTQPVEVEGRFAQLGEDLHGKSRVGVTLEAAVDRRSFGLEFQAELPSGGEAVGWEVSIIANLELVGAE
jgi:polyisoprenoid-binding protein YceI